MEPLRQLRAEHLVEMLRVAEVSLRAHAPGLDQLDSAAHGDETPEGTSVAGDTGRHLVVAIAAVNSVIDAAGKGRNTLTGVSDAVERGVTAATSDPSSGRAGPLLAQFIAGFAELGRNADAFDADRVAMACEEGARRMTESVRRVSPGSMVTVAESVAAAALAGSDDGMALADLLIEMAERGLDALEATPEASEQLADAGAVDAGAAGLLVLVDAMIAVVHGEDPELPAWEFPPDDEDDDETSSERFRYTVTLALDAGTDLAPANAAELLTAAWRALGDQVEAAVDGRIVRASVSTDDIGAVIEAAISLGRPSSIRVNDGRG